MFWFAWFGCLRREAKWKVQNCHLEDIEAYVRMQVSPSNLDPKDRYNFRRCCQKFSIENGELYYKKSQRVIVEKGKQKAGRRLSIIKDIDEGLGDTSHLKAMASHKGRDSTYA